MKNLWKDGLYIKNEPDRLMIFYSTIDRKRGTTKLFLIGNSITRVNPYIGAWGLEQIFRSMKQGDIKTYNIINEENNVLIALEYCKASGGKTMAIGNSASMIDKGTWQTFPQPKLPKSYNKYKLQYRFGFYYKNFKFLCEYLYDKEDKDKLFFIRPFYRDFKNLIVFSDIVKTSKLWQRDIYNISILNPKLDNLFKSFKENKIFYASDLCGTDFKQVIDFTIKK